MEGDAGWYYRSNDWDLNAVVRYACGGRVPPPPSSSSDDPFFVFPPPLPQQEITGDGMPDVDALLSDLPFEGDAAAVDELSIAFFAPLSSPPPAPPQARQQQVPTVLATIRETLQLLHQDNVLAPPPAPPTSGLQASVGDGPSSRSKRRKKQVKKEVKRVAADGASADPWAWRKYGQKPIKGSPYPRGYYRCSTDKACEARKMVERCRDDPDSFILTYTGGDHNHAAPVHRNSLAGTTRSRQQQPAGGGRRAPGGATATLVAAQPSPGQSTSGGMSTSPTTTTSPRSPSMNDECNQEEAECDEAAGASMVPMADVEMDAAELKTILDTVVNVGGDSSRYARTEDVEMGAEVDELKTLLDTVIDVRMEDDGGTGVSPTFAATPWVTALGDATGWS